MSEVKKLMDAKLTESQTAILKHAVGFDSSYPGFRNHYCVRIFEGGDKSYADCLALENEGLMEAGLVINRGRDQYFLVTRKGGEAIGLDEASVERLMEH